MTTTHSLQEYAAALLGPGPDGTVETVEPSKVEWLRRRLSGESKPVLPGYKVARQWRATDEDIATAIELLRPKRVELPSVPQFSGMTKTSQRRLAS